MFNARATDKEKQLTNKNCEIADSDVRIWFHEHLLPKLNELFFVASKI